jgi:hypothetical protein
MFTGVLNWDALDDLEKGRPAAENLIPGNPHHVTARVERKAAWLGIDR